VIIHLIHDTLELMPHAIMGCFWTNDLDFWVIAARLGTVVVLFSDIPLGYAHFMLFVMFLRRILRRRRRMLHPMINLRPLGVAHRLARTLHFLSLSPSIVNRSRTRVILTGHLVYSCIPTDILFLGDCAREKAGEVR
jgi:hypothetical protein